MPALIRLHPTAIISKPLSRRGNSLQANLVDRDRNPLVPQWTLIVIDIHLFWIVLLLDPQGFSPVASGDFHLPQRDLGISMGSLVAVEPSGTGLPSRLKNPKPFWA